MQVLKSLRARVIALYYMNRFYSNFKYWFITVEHLQQKEVNIKRENKTIGYQMSL